MLDEVAMECNHDFEAKIYSNITRKCNEMKTTSTY